MALIKMPLFIYQKKKKKTQTQEQIEKKRQ